MAVFFTSDQHYGHVNIIGYCGRPFADVSAMNEAMVARHNATVGTVYLFSVSLKTVSSTRSIGDRSTPFFTEIAVTTHRMST